jgi:hypothetical protein
MKKILFLAFLSGFLLADQTGNAADNGQTHVNPTIIVNEEITDLDTIHNRLKDIDLNKKIIFQEGHAAYVNDPENEETLNIDILDDLLNDAISDKNLLMATILVRLGADVNQIRDPHAKQIVEESARSSIKSATKR